MRSKSLYCWGANATVIFGDGQRFRRRIPGPVTVFGQVSEIRLGGDSACALTNGSVSCVGQNGNGQLGIPAFTTRSASAVTPVPVNAIGLAAGIAHYCALLDGASKTVSCWGANLSGQTGVAGPDQFAPVLVNGLGGEPIGVAAGVSFSCALLSNGAVRCWGANYHGQLGVTASSPPTSSAPLLVSGLDAVVSLGPGARHVCVLMKNSGVRCWGQNEDGQLGDGGTVSRHTPADVPGLTAGVKAVAGGGRHSCALTEGGAVKCWGANDSGQLGDGSNVLSRTVPVDVQGLSSGVSQIQASGDHTCALLTGGSVRCWGGGLDGELGDGSAWSETARMVSGFLASQLGLPQVRRDAAAAEESEPNNSTAQANPLTSNVSLRGRFSDTFDVYVLDKTTPGAITVALNNLPAAVESRVQLQLYFQNTAGSPVAVDVAAPFALTHNGAAGRYYVVVFTAGSTFDPAQTYDIVAVY
jgi:alpha-tubulin suppressor-like RCC1 family protein